MKSDQQDFHILNKFEKVVPNYLGKVSYIAYFVSTPQQWFPCGPLLARHLTWFVPGLFLPRSRP